ncbi:hypothetical protein [Thermoflexus sp.]|uniref:hypothetical protein n=1 Tax=Thermoflexus sp. TaxID=1969742 RepID=UPI002ADD571C|nr:hypothetical protein [Thermoflexus sp.]
MTLEDFSSYLKGKTLEDILHEGRKESAERIFSEAVVPLALLLSYELLKILLIPPHSLKTEIPPSAEKDR